MKYKKFVLILLVLILFAGLAMALCPLTIPCPYDGFNATMTGSQMIAGRLFYVYRCPNGHVFTKGCN